jgi:RNA polymerase sigma factor (sigma-70 family)
MPPLFSVTTPAVPSDSPVPREQIVPRHRGALVRYASRLLNGAAGAEDVVQEAFARYWAQPIETVAGHEAEWLFRVCRNLALDVLRKEARHGLREKLDGEASHEDHPGRILEQAEARRLLAAMVAALPANQQEVIRLKFEHGFSYKQIAQITDLSIGNVGFLIHTAVARLRRDWNRLQKGEST